MVRIFPPPPETGAIGEPEPGQFGLFLRHLQPLLPPDPLHACVIHPPSLLVQQGGDPPIPVAALLVGQRNDRVHRRSSSSVWVGTILLLRGPTLSYHAAGPAF